MHARAAAEAAATTTASDDHGSSAPPAREVHIPSLERLRRDDNHSDDNREKDDDGEKDDDDDDACEELLQLVGAATALQSLCNGEAPSLALEPWLELVADADHRLKRSLQQATASSKAMSGMGAMG